MIIATDKEFLGYATADSSWQKIPAVRDRRVHLIPIHPFNWFDRPPGINRLVGIPWVAHLLYPDHFSEDWLRGKIRDFYSRFYHYDLSDTELAELLAG